MNQYEYTTLCDTSLPHDAVVLYIRWFRRRMNYKDGTVSNSIARMIDALEYHAANQSADKDYNATRQRAKTLIKHLERVGLLIKLTPGNQITRDAAVYICAMATTDKSKSTATTINPVTAQPTAETPISQQPHSNQSHQPAQQPPEIQQTHGLQPEPQPAQRIDKEHPQQPYTVIPTKDLKEQYVKKFDEEKKPQKPRSTFKPPTLDEAIAYALEKNATEQDGKDFFFYYESINWMRGKNKIQKWKSALSGWISKNKTNKGQKNANSTATILAHAKSYSRH